MQCDVAIAGGGPAGIMLGYLLARQGVEVVVLEKHGDFLRDFRGDTIHPSTITLLGELGLRDEFLALPLNRVETMDVVIDEQRMTLVDFSTLPAPDDFLVFAPQWDLLNFLVTAAKKYPTFTLMMNTEATGILTTGDTVTGIAATSPDGDLEISATLTVAADGRGSRIRDAAGFVPDELGVPIDVLWFTLPKPANPPAATLGYVDARGIVLTIERGDHYQGGLVITKGGFAALQDAGLPALRKEIAGIAPVLTGVVDTLVDWDQIKLLSVQLNHLGTWYRDGLVCIGDAAHAMSPVMGVGVNYAIQDAVALANAIGPTVHSAPVSLQALAQFQARREAPVIRMQKVQRFAHERIARPATAGHRAIPRPIRGVLRLAQARIRRVLARVVGIGFLPEHVTFLTDSSSLR